MTHTAIAWQVTFRRNRFTPVYQSESIVVVVPEERLQLLLDALHSRYPEALIDTAERLGEAVVDLTSES